jgi:nucleotide-binding universal stress UspA family protein
MEAVGHDVETRQHAQDVLGLFETRARRAGVAFTGHHVQAIDVDDAIVDAARELGCDMIVMVTHGRGVLGSLLFGGHTKNVMARSKLPLLVLH